MEPARTGTQAAKGATAKRGNAGAIGASGKISRRRTIPAAPEGLQLSARHQRWRSTCSRRARLPVPFYRRRPRNPRRTRPGARERRPRLVHLLPCRYPDWVRALRRRLPDGEFLDPGRYRPRAHRRRSGRAGRPDARRRAGRRRALGALGRGSRRGGDLHERVRHRAVAGVPDRDRRARAAGGRQLRARALAAISLGLAGHAGLGERIGRNARFASIGSGVAAAAMGAAICCRTRRSSC